MRDPELVAHGEEVAARDLRPRPVGPVGGPPVPAVVPHDHLAFGRERGDLLEPGGVVAPRPVAQHEGDRPLPDHFVVDRFSVVVHEARAAHGEPRDLRCRHAGILSPAAP